MNRLPRSLDEVGGLRAARWLRESTKDQWERFGPESQRRQQDAFVERHGLVDTGLSWQVAHSGKTVWRSAAMREMVEAASAGAFDLLLLGYSDRWQRNLRRFLEVLEDDLHPAGVAIVMCDRRILSSDPRDWDELVAEAVAAERYSRRLSERITDAYAAKFRDHADPGGRAPWGFHRVGPSHVLAPDPATIGQVVEAFRLYAAGNATTAMVADRLGVTIDRVREAFRNPVYNGWAGRHGHRVPADWRSDPPVDDVLWEGVQRVLDQRSHGGPQPGRARRVDLLSGLLWCSCGRMVKSNGTAGRPPRHQRMHPGRCAAWGGHQTVWGDVHDAAVRAQLTGVRLDDATLARVVRAVGQEQRHVPVSIDAARAERRRRELALEHAAGRLSDEEYLAAARELRERPADPSLPPRVEPGAAVAYLRDLGELWARATEEERADIVHAVYARLTITRDGFEAVELTPSAYANGLAIAMPETAVVGATGVKAAGAVRPVRMPIVGRREWLRLARSA